MSADQSEPRPATAQDAVVSLGEEQSAEQVGSRPDEPIVVPEVLSLLPLREWVMFPVLVTPLGVGRETSVQLINESVVGGNRVIGVVALKDPSVENPTLDDVHPIGTAVVIRMMAQLDDGIRLIVQGLSRIEILDAIQTSPYLKVRVRVLPEPSVDPEELVEVEALKRNVGALFQKAVNLSPELPDEMQALVQNVDQPGVLADLITAQMPRFGVEAKQSVLEAVGVKKRLQKLVELLAREVKVLELGTEIHTQVSGEIDKTQREYYLREQLKTIQKELGEGDDRSQEIAELREALEAAKLPEEPHKAAAREIDRLERMPSASPEYTVSRTYIDWLTGLPWSVATKDNLDIDAVKRSLDKDHWGLEKVKDRILEYLAVRRFNSQGEMRQPILCFAGPPGVGKTSLGKSVARAMGRNFVRISLGGVRDEAEIRGHRRTYIGALPGQIIQGMKRAGSNNPIFMLDEIDKVASDFRGDPSSALLEVLDPEQNFAFRDHYLEAPFDLSRVLFITTANVLETILPPLRDRMEVIELSGYTEEEKLHIAAKHLIPKQIAEHGVKGRLRFQRNAVRAIVRGYTREAGVRNLERQIAGVCRKATRMFAESKAESLAVTPEWVEEFLGAAQFEHEELDRRTRIPGVVVGVVWTPVGGDIVFIEATAMPSPRNRPSQLTLTGQLGDVMKESATAALSYVRARHREIGAPEDFYETHDLHIHVPAGATPKDGPSAGVTMMVALASLFSGRPVLPRLAMTGEITVTGKVLPVGGIKEKVLAAHRAGIRTMILPTRNRKDFLEDIPKEVAEAIRFEFVDDARQVLDLAIDMPERLQPRGVRTTSLRRHGRVRKEPRVTAELQAPLPTPELESSPRQSL